MLNGAPAATGRNSFTGDDCGELAEGYVLLSDGRAVLNPCLENDCSGHGTCSWNEADGDEGLIAVSMCTCEDGYVGEDCGSCDEANLFFDDEAEGLNCVQSECPESCRSSANGTCNDEDPSDTSCACNEGYAGVDCNSCAEGFAFLMRTWQN